MIHHTLEEWIHFLHRLAPASTTAGMQKHLESCPQCRQKVEWWRRQLSDAAAKDAESTLSPWETRSLKDQHSRASRAGTTGSWSAEAELIWDSQCHPQPLGLRGLPGSPRQLLYRIGDYLIDVLVKAQPETSGYLLVGQVLCSSEPGRDVSKIQVILEWETKVHGTMTNAFGEFQIEYEDSSPARLSLQFQNNQVVIPLSLLSQESQVEK